MSELVQTREEAMVAELAKRIRPIDPASRKGLGLAEFQRVCTNGFGDGYNAFPHSAAWFQDRLFVGTTRCNFQLLKVQATFSDIKVHLWPVDGPVDVDSLYKELDRRAQIWRYAPRAGAWEGVFRAPLVPAVEGDAEVARDTGLRSMAVFQGKSDPVPALYAATWAPGRAPGALLLRSIDGLNFEPATPYGIIEGLPIIASRVLITFKGKLYTSPTGVRGHGVKMAINNSGYPRIFETDDPLSGKWHDAAEPGFGDPDNLGVFTMAEFDDHLYAGTMNNNGFQLWKSRCEGEPPYKWTQVIREGAFRGPNNQVVVSMKAFNGALYVGSAIQNGGHDLTNNIGPAASELIRVHADDSWDLIVGNGRRTPDGQKIALSGLTPGYGSPFNGYFWSMEAHDGWLYLGTMSTGLWPRFVKPETFPDDVRKLVERLGVERIIGQHGGCDLWRTSDGENWLPVTQTGIDNEYNYGIRNMVSTPHGLFLAVANPFGKRVAVCEDGEWKYVDNARGGLEIWQGTHDKDSLVPLADISETALWK